MAELYQELRQLSDDDLIERYDSRAKTTEFWADHYLNELNRRHQEHLTNQIKWMTVVITLLTGVVTVATLVNVSFFIYDVLT